MARARILKPDFFEDEKLAMLPLGARSLFSALWCLADREGRLQDRPARIAAFAFPPMGDEKLQAQLRKGVPGWLDSLAEAGCIERYEVEGEPLMWIPSWERHQKVHINEAKSVLPPPMVPNDHQRHPMVEDVAGIRKESEVKGKEAELEAEGGTETFAPIVALVPPSYPAIKSAWENKIGFLSLADAEEFRGFAGQVPQAWFMAAIEDTTKCRHPSWGYCKSILRTCVEEQRPPSSIRVEPKPRPGERPKSLRYQEA